MENIETKRYILRTVTQEDAKYMFEILSDDETIQTLNMEKHNNIYDTKKLIEDYLNGLNSGEKYPFAIIDKETKEFIGVFLIKLDLFDEDCFEFTIYINKQFWNQGVYTEVLKTMTKFAFDTVNTGNFRGFVMEKNEVSSRVLEKCNFKLEKIFKVDGIEGNIKSYLMTKEDYEISIERGNK